jgi:hypothetical protein
MFSAEEWAEARDRGGAPKEDRPAEVDNALEPSPELGRNNGLPLVGDSYDDYPSVNRLTLPQSRDFVIDLVEHDRVTSLRDAVEELCGDANSPTGQQYRRALTKALDLFDVDRDEHLSGGSFDVPDMDDDDSDELDLFTKSVPRDIPNPAENPLVVGHLYAVAGLSVSEITAYLSDELDGAVYNQTVRQALIDVGLLGGQTTTEREQARRRTGVSVQPSVERPSPERDESGRHPATNLSID